MLIIENKVIIKYYIKYNFYTFEFLNILCISSSKYTYNYIFTSISLSFKLSLPTFFVLSISGYSH